MRRLADFFERGGACVPPAGIALAERELHEYVAEVEGHESQVTGVVGYFYAMYRAEVLARVAGIAAATSSKSAAAKG